MLRATTIALLTLLLAPGGAHAQLAEPAGGLGVVMGHLHVVAPDVAAARQFWTALGGAAGEQGPIQYVGFPGVLVLFREGQPAGGTLGSVINHVGFQVPDIEAAEARWTAAGLEVEAGGFPGQRWLTAPGGVRIEILQDPELAVPIRMHHVHWNTNEIPEMQAWYARAFGAEPGMRGRFVAADLPGVNLTFTEPEDGLAATEGRALDHVGFETADLRQLLAHLEAEGIALDSDYREIADAGIAIAFLTDPWGTRIELTQNLRP